MYAHSVPGVDDRSKWESLIRHLSSVSTRAAEHGSAFGAEEWASLAGLWHDLGKASADFQAMISSGDAEAHLEGSRSNSRKRVDHSTAGARFACDRLGPNVGRLLAYVIAGHHAGLADWTGEPGQQGLKDRLTKGARLLEAALAGQPPPETVKAPLPTTAVPNGADFSFWIRMLASAVFDADFLQTEAFINPDKGDARARWPALTDLPPRLAVHLSGEKFSNAPDTEVNRLRREVLAECAKGATALPGLFSLTVPTGGGKTLSSLAFALEHARERGLRRVIYAIPYTSIIEQTAKIFRDAVGEDAVLEHHSAIGPAHSGDETRLSRLASENWDAPLIVTTTVQLFESLFASRTSRLRKIHNLARSVIVLDEAQCLPGEVLRPVTAVIAELVRYYGATVVLCTATQPALQAVFKALPARVELAPDPPRLFAALDRVTVEMPPAGERRSWDALAADIGAVPQRQALIIVNKRADCQTLYRLLPPEGRVHLSTWQCPAHRQKLLDEVKCRLKKHQPSWVVSTSLIEAGVDIDFPVVFRAMAGLDSLAQAAGRCNREGLQEKGRFVVFRPEGTPPKGHFGQAIAAAEAALRVHGDAPFRPAAFDVYFKQLYWTKGDDALDAFGMGELLGLGIAPRRGKDRLDISFRTAADRFRMIDDAQESVVVPYDDKASKAIGALEAAGPSRERLRALQRYTVPVYQRDLNPLHKAGVIKPIEDSVWLLVQPNLYREDVGLDLSAAGLLDPRSLVF